MEFLLIFAVTLLIAVLVSELAERSVLSTAVVFLLAGFVVGPSVLGWLVFEADEPLVADFAELAMFTVLFTDGMRVNLTDLRSEWKLVSGALLLGLPLTIAGIALLGRFVAGLPWTHAFLVGAVLSPTDPVFAAAVVGRKEVPATLRRLLNVESGMNDGLALPFVVMLLSAASGSKAPVLEPISEVVFGIVLGIGISWIVVKLESIRYFSAAQAYQPLVGFSIGLLLLGTCKLTGANEFLAAFTGGVTVANAGPKIRETFRPLGSVLGELLKLSGLLIFGALITPKYLAAIHWTGYLFVFLVILLARPVAVGPVLFGSGMSWREWLAAVWFGPRGFASVFYGLLVIKSGVPNVEHMFHLIALVVAVSVIAHSSTDYFVACWFSSDDGPSNDAFGEDKLPADEPHDTG